MVERIVDVDEVTGSIPVPPTKYTSTWPAPGLVLLWEPERCADTKRHREAGEVRASEQRKAF